MPPTTPSSFIECTSLYGQTVQVPREHLVFRPTAYAVILHEGQVLVVNTRSTGKFAFPGGGVELGERLEEALQREVWEETGLKVEVLRFLTFRESFFHYDPSGNSYHCFLFYYLCRPLTFMLKSNEAIEDGEAENPGWVPLSALDRNNFQGPPSVIEEIQSGL